MGHLAFLSAEPLKNTLAERVTASRVDLAA